MRTASAVRSAAAATLVLALGATVGGCGLTRSTAEPAATVSGAAAATTVTVEITDAGCTAEPASVPAGPVTFRVANVSGSKVSEAELQDGGLAVGEQENLTPGLTGTFSLLLPGGDHDYEIWCPGAKTDRTAFEVTGTATENWRDDPAQVAAVAAYKTFVSRQADLLVTEVRRFTAAVDAGKVAEAQSLFATARRPYERIESVAETFGDLDPRIDGRIDDAPSAAEFTGFHRIEQALWDRRSTAGLKPVTAKLNADVATLAKRVRATDLQPAQVANGSTTLINEVQTSKITGEEDRYSHIDLADFEANVDGAAQAYAVLEPVLQRKQPELVQQIRAQLAATDKALARYARSPGHADSGYVDYRTVTQPERQQLSRQVNVLADVLSKMSGVLT